MNLSTVTGTTVERSPWGNFNFTPPPVTVRGLGADTVHISKISKGGWRKPDIFFNGVMNEFNKTEGPEGH